MATPTPATPDWRAERRQRLPPCYEGLLTWVETGCTAASWDALTAMAEAPGSPRWLNRQSLDLDELEHQVLALALAHLTYLHLIDVTEERWGCAFGSRSGLHGLDLITLLDLAPLEGFLAVDLALRGDAPLLSTRLLIENSEIEAGQADAVATLLYRSFSLNLAQLSALLAPAQHGCAPEGDQ